jgi:hypothetical protein
MSFDGEHYRAYYPSDEDLEELSDLSWTTWKWWIFHLQSQDMNKKTDDPDVLWLLGSAQFDPSFYNR